MICVIGQRKVARQIDFDSVPLADGDGRKHVQEFVEDLCGGLPHALRESLAHEVSAGGGKSTGGPDLIRGIFPTVKSITRSGFDDVIEDEVRRVCETILNDRTKSGNGA